MTDDDSTTVSVLKALARLLFSRKDSFVAEFKRTTEKSLSGKYEIGRSLEHVLEHWNEDGEFAREV